MKPANHGETMKPWRNTAYNLPEGRLPPKTSNIPLEWKAGYLLISAIYGEFQTPLVVMTYKTHCLIDGLLDARWKQRASLDQPLFPVEHTTGH